MYQPTLTDRDLYFLGVLAVICLGFVTTLVAVIVREVVRAVRRRRHGSRLQPMEGARRWPKF